MTDITVERVQLRSLDLIRAPRFAQRSPISNALADVECVDLMLRIPLTVANRPLVEWLSDNASAWAAPYQRVTVREGETIRSVRFERDQ